MDKEQENQIEAKANEEKLQLQVKEATSDIIQHCQGKKTEMENLIDKFDKKIGLRWDSKVPQRDKRWYYFFTLKAVDAEKVKAEIQEFLTLYEGIEKLQDIEGTEDYKKACEKVDDLLKKLEKMCEDSKNKQYTSDSSTVCTLYKNLDSEGGTLERKLQSVSLAIHRRERAASEAKVNQLEKVNEELAKSAKGFEERLEKATKQLESLTEKHDRLMNILMMLHPEVAEMIRDPPEKRANTQGANEQQGAQASNAQSCQQQKPNTRAANGQQSTHASGTGFDQQQSRAANDPNMSSSRSSSMSSSSAKDGDQPGPSSKLSEMSPISRSQSLSSLCSNNSDSDIEVISRSQCR